MEINSVTVNYPGTETPFQKRTFIQEEDGSYGRMHSVDDKPSFEAFYATGELMRQIWHKEGEVHREGNKPASIIYHRDGSIKHEGYFLDDNEVA